MTALSQSIKSLDKRVLQFGAAGAVLLIVAAIATPNLLRSRMAADESRRFAAERLYASVQPQGTALPDSPPVSLHTEGMIAADLKSATSGPAVATASDGSTPANVARKLVRTAALELTVKSPADVAEQIRRMAETMGGYLESAQIGGSKDAPTADIGIRVPAARFEDAKAGIRNLAARVESEKTDAQDVTRQYVDMVARLRNLRAEEAQYLIIMKSAFKVTDLLEVEQKLSEVRGQIEQQQAEFQTLSKQVETVAIVISLRAFADTQVFGLNWHPLYELKIAARNGLEAMGEYASAMAAILFYVPVVLAWSLTILFAAIIAWRLLRWTGHRFFDWPSPPAPQKAAGTV